MSPLASLPSSRFTQTFLLGLALAGCAGQRVATVPHQATQVATSVKESRQAPELVETRAAKRDAEVSQLRDVHLVPTLGALYKKPINLEFRDASVKMVFEALSRTTGINFIFDREVKSDLKTTVFLKQTSLEDSIDVILTTNQLDKKILNASSVLIYPSNPAKIKEYQDLIVKAFYLANVEAKQTATMLKTVLKVKEVFVDDRNNMLILRETPETILLAEKLIALLDRDEPEVMLDVAVLEVNRTRLLNLGIQFSDQLTISPLGGTETPGGSTGTATRTFKLSDLMHLNRDLLGITVPSATVNLQHKDGDANLLANPRLRVRDREKAKILIGDRVPVVTTTSTPNGFVAESIQYIDVGLKLEVEPTIHLRDEIGLKISLEVSSLVSSIRTNNGSQAFQIGTRNYQSALRLNDGETQILAGLLSDEERSAGNRFPLVGSLPVLGRLFSSQSDNKQKTEIVMSITPHLIRNIRRKEPAAETFWSGTEATLRTKPLQLRSLDAAGLQNAANDTKATPVAAAASVPAAQAGAAIANRMNLRWKGPGQGRVGEVVTLDLSLDSPDALRAAPFQLAFEPAKFEVVSVKEGEFFSKGGKATFGHVVDKASGRVSVAATSGDATGVSGEGRLLSIELRLRAADPEAEIIVLGMTPVGSTQAITRQVLPAIHKIVIAP
jgi:general secretion pathway protein D